MIPCNGTHVIAHTSKHGNSYYRCTMANAKALVENCLKYEAPGFAKQVAKLKDETRTLLPVSWLVKALAEVRHVSANPRALRRVLYGAGPGRDAEDVRPEVVITQVMQEELVLSFFRYELKLETLDSHSSISAERATACWNTLQFLAPARQRLSSGVLFIPDFEYEGYEKYRAIQADKWKEGAREERVIATYYCEFLNNWAAGNWSVEALNDA